MRFVFAAVLLFAATLSPLAAQEPAMPGVSEAERAALQGALTRGLTLYQYDQAAWHTTDTMLEDVPEDRLRTIGGWIVEPVGHDLRVIYWRQDADAFFPVYSADYSADGVSARTLHPDNAPALDQAQSALVKARQIALPTGVARCSAKPFNSVVMPTGKGDGSVYVYWLTPQETLSAMPLGGHYRYEVRGGEVVDQRAFSKSCIDLPTAQGGADGKTPAAVGIVHILDPVPTEIHVFSAFAGGLPIFVSTIEPKRPWAVEVSGGQPQARLIDPEE